MRKTILASELPGFIEKYGYGGPMPGKQNEEIFKEVNKDIYLWADGHEFEILNLIYIPTNSGGYDFLINYKI